MRIGRTTQHRSISVPVVVNSISSSTLPVTANTHVINAPVNIGVFTGGEDGQTVTIRPGTGYSVLMSHGTLQIGGDITLANSDHMTLQKWGSTWYEVSRYGVVGSQGNQGDNGVAGDPGYQGGFGTTGFTGAQGTTGSMGAQGNQGSPGSDGNQGPPGEQGVQGPQGYDGNQGPQGNPCVP